MGPSRIAKSVLAWLTFVASAQAAEFTFSSHVASGSGSANVSDSGPLMLDSDSTFDAADPRMSYSAVDQSSAGSLGAVALSSGRSEVLVLGPEMWFELDLDVTYLPSLFPGGDRPGGMAEGELSSVIEFPLPLDEIEWSYKLRIDQTIGFDGSSLVVVENVTRSQQLVELTSDMPGFVDTVIVGEVGDIIRISSQMSGSGSAAAGVASTRQYEADLDMLFTIPEPATFALLALGAVVSLRRRRR